MQGIWGLEAHGLSRAPFVMAKQVPCKQPPPSGVAMISSWGMQPLLDAVSHHGHVNLCLESAPAGSYVLCSQPQDILGL